MLKLQKGLEGLSYSDLRSELQSIVREKYGTKSQGGDYWSDYPYIQDVYESEVVVEKGGLYYIADYVVKTDGTVEVGPFYAAKKSYSKKGTKPVDKLGRG